MLGDVEDMLQATAMFACCLKVILQRGDGIGEMIHLRATRHAPISQQFVTDEPTDTFRQFGRARRRQHAHGASDFVHQVWRTGQPIVLPAGLDEGDDRILDLGGIADRFLHQCGDDTQRLAARQPLRRTACVRIFFRTQTLDVIVQRSLDVKQGAGHIEQRFLIGWTHAVGDLIEHPPLIVDHPARHRQCQHAQGVANALKNFALDRQLRRIIILLTQEQIERFLDPQQIVLQRARYRIKQRAVMPGHRATGVRQLAGIRQQAVQCISAAQQLHLRAALLGLGHDIQQHAGNIVRIATTQAVFAAFYQLPYAAIDLADQLAHFAGMTLEHALLQPFQHAGSNPPQPSTVHVIATRRDRQQGLAHANQLLRGVLTTEPAQ